MLSTLIPSQPRIANLPFPRIHPPLTRPFTSKHLIPLTLFEPNQPFFPHLGSCSASPSDSRATFEQLYPHILPTLATSTSAQISSLELGEDLINKSLLDSLNAQTDFDVPQSSDSDRPLAASYESSSNSSSGSPSVPFHLTQQSSHPHLTRPESPSDKSLLHHMPTQDNLYNMHTAPVPGLFNNSTNTNMHLPSEFSGEFDPQKHSQVSAGKLNGLNNTNYSREQFNNFPNTNRPRHQSQSLLNSTAPPFREPGTYFPSTHTDIYSSGLMSPTSAHIQPHDPRTGFDISRTQGLGGGHKNFQDHPFTNSVGMIPSHQGSSKPGFSQPQSTHASYPPGAPFMNGMYSQTPYGPHVPTNIPQSASNAAGNNPNSANYGANKDNNNNQEEISTIFVVGFPEDMQVC